MFKCPTKTVVLHLYYSVPNMYEYRVKVYVGWSGEQLLESGLEWGSLRVTTVKYFYLFLQRVLEFCDIILYVHYVPYYDEIGRPSEHTLGRPPGPRFEPRMGSLEAGILATRPPHLLTRPPQLLTRPPHLLTRPQHLLPRPPHLLT